MFDPSSDYLRPVSSSLQPICDPPPARLQLAPAHLRTAFNPSTARLRSVYSSLLPRHSHSLCIFYAIYIYAHFYYILVYNNTLNIAQYCAYGRHCAAKGFACCVLLRCNIAHLKFSIMHFMCNFCFRIKHQVSIMQNIGGGVARII